MSWRAGPVWAIYGSLGRFRPLCILRNQLMISGMGTKISESRDMLDFFIVFVRTRLRALFGNSRCPAQPPKQDICSLDCSGKSFAAPRCMHFLPKRFGKALRSLEKKVT